MVESLDRQKSIFSPCRNVHAPRDDIQGSALVIYNAVAIHGTQCQFMTEGQFMKSQISIHVGLPTIHATQLQFMCKAQFMRHRRNSCSAGTIHVRSTTHCALYSICPTAMNAPFHSAFCTTTPCGRMHGFHQPIALHYARVLGVCAHPHSALCVALCFLVTKNATVRQARFRIMVYMAKEYVRLHKKESGFLCKMPLNFSR